MAAVNAPADSTFTRWRPGSETCRPSATVPAMCSLRRSARAGAQSAPRRAPARRRTRWPDTHRLSEGTASKLCRSGAQYPDRHDVRPGDVHEVREIQTALGLVATDYGLCIIPASARQMRSDVRYRLLEGDGVTSPVILNHRVNDTSYAIGLIKRLIREMYEENPAWLDLKHSLIV